MDTMPFLHADRAFSIVFFEDLGFTEVRKILDELLAENAFSPEVQEQHGFYLINVENSSFSVWVSDMEVIIKRT
ncbi:MAG: hypothetical protein NTW27_13155 [Deltaproteobacteria bacterium]|nr:hypothetical protein [Deltaproteobacteria bacterium]